MITNAQSLRASASKVSRPSLARAIGRLDGALIVNNIGVLDLTVFSTSSWQQRADRRTNPCSGFRPSRLSAPISLSSTLCRPTSSRRTSISPAKLQNAAACTAPVARSSSCRARIAPSALWIASGLASGLAFTGAIGANAAATESIPQIPQLLSEIRDRALSKILGSFGRAGWPGQANLHQSRTAGPPKFLQGAPVPPNAQSRQRSIRGRSASPT